MGWMKHATVDVVVTAVIVLGTWGGQTWAAWPVWVYTPLILVLRLGALGARMPQKTSPVPDAVYHVLYAVNVAAPAVWAATGGDSVWYWIAVAWGIVWGLSIAGASRRVRSR